MDFVTNQLNKKFCYYQPIRIELTNAPFMEESLIMVIITKATVVPFLYERIFAVKKVKFLCKLAIDMS